MDAPVLRQLSTDNGCSLEYLLWGMDYRDGEREIERERQWVREIRAVSVIWWWWWRCNRLWIHQNIRCTEQDLHMLADQQQLIYVEPWADTGWNLEDLVRTMYDRDRWRERESGKSVLSAWLHDDNDIIGYTHTIIGPWSVGIRYPS